MDSMQLKEIGTKLKQRRIQMGYTQEAAAEKSQISYSYYTKIENGNQLPSLEVAMDIAKVFNLSLDKWLFTDNFKLSDSSPEICDLLKSIQDLNPQSVHEVQTLLSKIISCLN